MPGKIILGAQWGDEGKGKYIDVFAEKADLVVRSQGGNNAGHTVVANGVKYKLQLIPSGILYPNCINIIGPGVVVNPKGILGEIDTLQAQGVCTDHLTDLLCAVLSSNELVIRRHIGTEIAGM